MKTICAFYNLFRSEIRSSSGGVTVENLESNYDCANASEDLQQLTQQSEELKNRLEASFSQETEEELNRVENQIHFIKNKCSIRP
jgi:hypothetical protein